MFNYLRVIPLHQRMKKHYDKLSVAERKLITYRGISANSWLLPIGIRQRHPAKKIINHRIHECIDCLRKKIKCHDAHIDRNNHRRYPPDDKAIEDKNSFVVKYSEHSKNTTNATSPIEPISAHLTEPVAYRDAELIKNLHKGKLRQKNANCLINEEEFELMWKRVTQRPGHSGSLFVIRRHQSVPLGLSLYTFIQGRSILKAQKKRKAVVGANSNLSEFPNAVYKLAPTADSRELKTFNCQTKPTRHNRANNAIRMTEKLYNNNLSSIELVINCIGVTAKSSNSVSHQIVDSHLSDESDEQPNKMKNRFNQTLNLRAISAPPDRFSSQKISSFSNSIKHTSQTEPQLYWRTRSAYHKKQLFSNSEESTCIYGSSWRPLLQNENSIQMEHRAGCPYQCKCCFKACLVSSDFVQKIRDIQLHKEATDRVRAPNSFSDNNHNHFYMNKQDRLTRSANRHRLRLQHPENIVSVALAQNQPLYQSIHSTSKIY